MDAIETILESDHDLMMTHDQRSYIRENEYSQDDQNKLISDMGNFINAVSKIQHDRMVEKGFYNTFYVSRQLILDKVKQKKKTYLSSRKSEPSLSEGEAFDDFKWWEKILREHTVNFILKQIGLIHEEAGEASSAIREGNRKDDKLTDELGVGAELADIFIRGLDLAGFMGIDLGSIIRKKIGYNTARPHMHGKDA